MINLAGLYCLKGYISLEYLSKQTRKKLMNNTTVKTKIISKVVVKPTQQDIKLDLNKVLEQAWNQGLPNGISNVF